jgi:hypothetical protein
MNIGELRKAIEGLPDDMRVGVQDADGEIVEVQSAQVLQGEMPEAFFYIHPNGGFGLFDEVTGEP